MLDNFIFLIPKFRQQSHLVASGKVFLLKHKQSFLGVQLEDFLDFINTLLEIEMDTMNLNVISQMSFRSLA